MEFFNGKFAIKHFPLLLGHFDTTMVFFFLENRKFSIIGVHLKKNYVFFNYILVKIQLMNGAI